MARSTLVSLALALFSAVSAAAMDFPCKGKAELYFSDNDIYLPIPVEIASTPREQAHGLMFRKDLPDNLGMLFLFESNEPRAFWMKNTPLSLDITFFQSDGQQVQTHEQTVPLSLTPLPSPPAIAALETLASRYETSDWGLQHFSFDVDDESNCSDFVLDHPLRTIQAE